MRVDVCLPNASNSLRTALPTSDGLGAVRFVLGCALALECSFGFGSVLANERFPIGQNKPRPVTLMAESRVASILSKLPPVWDPWLQEMLYGADTVWYDRHSIVPGYQDSFGDNRSLPIGFRPNTIQSQLINLAVPGGHEQLFLHSGEFHFPFGRVGLAADARNTFVVNFWRAPRKGGQFLPVVWSNWNPNANTHRIEWVFPRGTVFGEVILITDRSGADHVFEVRTRTRELDGWVSDVFRPFPNADLFADALEFKRTEKSSWRESASISRLVSHLRDPETLRASRLAPVRFQSAFTPIEGAVDELPPVDDESILVELLHEAPLRSVKNTSWKRNGSLETFAASTQSAFHIVPRNYNAAFFEVSDAFCNRCHRDAGRPFKDYYRNVIAYGELWGEDDTVTWHPFDSRNFVDSSGRVVGFNTDNRRFRQDFISAGLLEEYQPSKHPAGEYKRIQHGWKNYRY